MVVAEATETWQWLIYDKTYFIDVYFVGLLHSINGVKCNAMCQGVSVVLILTKNQNLHFQLQSDILLLVLLV